MVFWKKSQRNGAEPESISATEENGAKKVQFTSKVKGQLWILALCRFAEPVALTSVFPYLYFMIESFNVPKKDIAFWVGITSASFAISQFFSGVIWGRLSDRYGRKYTIIAGLTGTLLSCLLFGFAQSMPVAIFARCVAGLLNGNVGIMRTFVAEIVPQKELQPFAFSLMPLVWSVGSIFGPMIGGFLSDPVRNHPDHFSPGGFLSKYPFCLPNLFNCMIFTVSIIIGYLFLEESLESIKHEKDSGLELGKKITKIFAPKEQKQKNMRAYVGDESSDDESSLLLPPSDEETRTEQQKQQPTPAVERSAPPSIREAFTVQSTLNIIVYAFLALQGVAFDQLLPVQMSYPGKKFDQHNPLKFFGGFGMASTEIGAIFSVFGFLAMATQFFVYPPIARKLGPLLTLKACFIIYPTVYFLVPFAIYLPEKYQKPALYVLLFAKQTAGVFSFPNMIIMLTNSASSLRVLGTLNGIATTAASLGRAIGPSIGGAAFSYGQRIQYLILPWWLIAGISIVGALPVVMLVEGKGFAANDAASKAAAAAAAASASSSQATTANGSAAVSVVGSESDEEASSVRKR